MAIIRIRMKNPSARIVTLVAVPALQSYFVSENRMVTVITTGTGSPLSRVAENRHSWTAAIAACSNKGSRRNTRTSRTIPSSEMIASVRREGGSDDQRAHADRVRANREDECVLPHRPPVEGALAGGALTPFDTASGLRFRDAGSETPLYFFCSSW
jgi:hypothetical protein